jgi:hypothetical protein
VEKYCRNGQATDDNMAHARCMLDTEGYRHTLRICNTYGFPTPTVVTRTCLNVTFVLTLPVLFKPVYIRCKTVRPSVRPLGAAGFLRLGCMRRTCASYKP